MRPEHTPLKDDWRHKLHELIFEADTPAGKWFDIILLIMIVFSVIIVMLESVPGYQEDHGTMLLVLEWGFTAVFTVEYILRLMAVKRPSAYALSFFGIVDLLALLPTYLSIFVFGTQAFIVVRALRLLRVFRVLKLGNYLDESQVITKSLVASQRKISVFLFAVMMIVLIIGAIMYLVEGATNEGFNSIPSSVYWAVVTLTTVGFGDITPQTALGQFISAVVMIIGYAVIAVPTGIVSAEMVNQVGKGKGKFRGTQSCRFCGEESHHVDAKFCQNCGHGLNPTTQDQANPKD
ncbi:MAG: ion transporter [Saprospiraceae bacterium]